MTASQDLAVAACVVPAAVLLMVAGSGEPVARWVLALPFLAPGAALFWAGDRIARAT